MKFKVTILIILIIALITSIFIYKSNYKNKTIIIDELDITSSSFYSELSQNDLYKQKINKAKNLIIHFQVNDKESLENIETSLYLLNKFDLNRIILVNESTNNINAITKICQINNCYHFYKSKDINSNDLIYKKINDFFEKTII